MAADLRYWDSCCFLGFLKDEYDKAEQCSAVLRAAEAGELTIVTSALTITEVIKLKKHTSIGRDESETVRKFFERSSIVVRPVDRAIAELARELVWDNYLNPKDAVHVATALRARAPRLDTTDGALLNQGQIEYDRWGPLKICLPSWDLPVQLSLKTD